MTLARRSSGNRRARRPRPRHLRGPAGLGRSVGFWAGLVAVTLVTVGLVRRACRSRGAHSGYRQRLLAGHPRAFDPRRVPTHIRVLRTAQPYRMAFCVADYRGHCVQRLPLEGYVAGVVAAEEGTFRNQPLPDARSHEAHQARIARAWQLQAIAARTYALYAALADKYYVATSGFHLTDTPRDQAYTDRVPPAIRRAVHSTAGQVLVDRRGRLLYAEYSASCRGRGTRDVVHRHQHIPCHPRCRDFAFPGSSHHRGMCQWGSYLYAADGRPLSWLLRHYYPNAHLLRLP